MGKSFFLSGSFAIRIVADCIAEIMFSPSKSQKQGMDVPVIVSMWPFSNAQRQALHASVVLCSHKFSNTSKSDDKSTQVEKSRRLGTVGQAIPGKGTKAGGSKPFHTVHLSGVILPPALSALAELLCALSEVKTDTETEAEREVEGEGEAEGDAGAGDVSCEDIQPLYNTLSVVGAHRSQQGMSGSTSATDSTDQQRATYDDCNTISLPLPHKTPFLKSSSLHNIDKAFLHQNALTHSNGHAKTGDTIHPTESIGAAAAAAAASAALLSASAEAVLKPKIPMKFSIKLVDPSSRYSSTTSTSTATSTSNDGLLGLKSQSDNPPNGSNSSNSSNNGLSSNRVNGAEKGGKGTLPWSTRKRAQEVPYFIVRTKASTNTNALCYYPEVKRRPLTYISSTAHDVASVGVSASVSGDVASSRSSGVEDPFRGVDSVTSTQDGTARSSSNGDTNGDGNCDAGAGAGDDEVEVVMKSRAPILEIRWSKDENSIYTATSASPSSSSSSSSLLSTSPSSMLAKRIREVRGRTQAGQLRTQELGNSVDVTQETLDSSTALTVNKKRKKPLNDIKSSPNGVLSGKKEGSCEGYYEVVSGADLPVMYVVPAQHSRTIVKENKDLELAGAVLNPMNEYDIYAPETIQERERRRQTM